MAVTERMTALEAARLIRALRNKQNPIVFEIGAGYGALALALSSVLPEATYVIVDRPETLKLSACYLATRQDAPVVMAPPSIELPREPGFVLCLATALDRLEGLPIDLAIQHSFFRRDGD